MTPSQAQRVIQSHITTKKSERDRWDKFHDWYLAEREDKQNWLDDWSLPSGDDSLTLETNYPYAWVDTMIASVCPTNPMITITPMHPDAEEYAKRRERLANFTMRRNKLYKKGWRVAGHAALFGYGITKTVWNFKKRRPVTMVVDPRRVSWDCSVEDWEDITYIAEATVVRKEEFLARTQRRNLGGGRMAPPRYRSSVAKQAKFGGFPNWLKRSGHREADTLHTKSVFEYVVVWEFYDFTRDTYWHLLEGVDEPLYEQKSLPYRWVRNPYDLVSFNDNMMDTTGISDIHLISNLQDRLNEMDTLELWHVQTTMPKGVLNEGALGNPEAAKDSLQNAVGPGAVASIELAQGYRDIREVFSYLPTATLSPDFRNMRNRIERVIEFTLALPQYMRGGVGQVEVATEAALADAGIRTRNGRRIRAMEEWQASIALKYVSLWAERMNPLEPVSIRSDGSEDIEILSYVDLGFDNPESLEREWWFDTEAAPYSPTENTALIQLQKLQQYMPVLLQSPNVDKIKLFKKLLELLKLTELFTNEAPPVPMPGQSGMPGSAGIPGNVDELEANIPPELMAQIQAFQSGAAPLSPGVSEPRVEI